MLFVVAAGSFNPFLQFPFSPSINVIFLILSVHTAFTIGFLTTYYTTKQSELTINATKHDQYLYLFITGITTVFSFGVILTDITSGSLPVISEFLNVSDARQSHWQSAYSSGGVDSLLNALSYLTLIYIISFPYSRRHFRASYLIFLLALVSLVDFSLQKGARSIIVYAVIGCLAVYIAVNQTKMSRMLIISSALVLAFYILGAEFYLARSPNFNQAPESFLRHNCAGASYSDIGADLSINLKALVLSSCYFSSPPYYFDIFLDQNQGRNFLIGGYNLSIFYSDLFIESRNDIAAIFAQLSYGQNPWSTAARDFFIDFGYTSPVFLFVLGCIVGLQANAFPANTYMGAARIGVLACFGFMLPLISPLVIRPIIYPFVFLVIFPYLLQVFFAASGAKIGRKYR
ncbi:hypothetical protein [Salibaculum halophilum]|uniref:hypothetical protein n=1 Tax=Salibaculum halophilum TaxID=1914408 RepID=UPI00117993E7|nr:hypothetical protein [Salibaculum halophilum]